LDGLLSETVRAFVVDQGIQLIEKVILDTRTVVLQLNPVFAQLYGNLTRSPLESQPNQFNRIVEPGTIGVAGEFVQMGVDVD
jgi:hypothetical protein